MLSVLCGFRIKLTPPQAASGQYAAEETVGLHIAPLRLTIPFLYIMETEGEAKYNQTLCDDLGREVINDGRERRKCPCREYAAEIVWSQLQDGCETG
jgi:hypothetical protein